MSITAIDSLQATLTQSLQALSRDDLTQSAWVVLLREVHKNSIKLKARWLSITLPFELKVGIPRQLDILGGWLQESLRILAFPKFYKKRLEAIFQQMLHVWNRILDEYTPPLQALLSLLSVLDQAEAIPSHWQKTAALFSTLHQSGHSLLVFLLGQRRPDRIYRLFSVTTHLSKEEAKIINLAFQQEPPVLLRSEEERYDIALAFTKELGVQQAGRIPKTQETQVLRPPRRHHAERAPQLLRQTATQLYFAFANILQAHPDWLSIAAAKRPKLVEVEVMHLACDGKNHLLIALNEHAVVPYLESLFSEKDLTKQLDLKAALCQEHVTLRAAGAEGKVRTQRYGQKLAQRVFGDAIALPKSMDTKDQADAVSVATTLRAGKLGVFQYDSRKQKDFQTRVHHLLAETEPHVYFVVAKHYSHKERHAEEFLSDIAACAKRQNPHVRSCVAGKKRPCMGCSGRMTGTVDRFGQFPGNLWFNTIEHQPPSVARQTAHLFFSQSAHITEVRSGKTCPDYGTDSESEPE